jgi:ribosome-associated protein
VAKIGKPQTSKGLAVMCARVAEDKLAKDVLILDLKKIETAPSDFFVLCSCDSVNQMKAVVDAVEMKCVEVGIKRPKVEGFDGSIWMLLDFFDVVVHVMLKEAREYYKLEKLWGDAQFIVLTEDGKPRAYKREEVKTLLQA